MEACDVAPSRGTLDVADARIIAPGDPSRSVLWLRMQAEPAHRMPPIGSGVTDTDGVALIGEWIESLEACPSP